MTYCVAIKLNAGLVFLSDSRTNAGVDQISTFRKTIVYEKPDDRFMVLLTAGNLSISQSVREILQVERLQDDADPEAEPLTIWNATSMFDVARVLGAAIRHVHQRDGESLKQGGVDFNVTMLLGGQIKGEGMRLFQVYEADSFQTDKIVCIDEHNPYFQMLHNSWSQKLREIFDSIEYPMWKGEQTAVPLMVQAQRHKPLKKISAPNEKLI